MIKTSRIIEDVQGEFEGGNSLSVNWDILIRRAMQNVLDNTRPDTLKRRVPIYGGLASDLHLYYCPSDVDVPSDLYSNDNERKFKYIGQKAFHEQELYDRYTIETINGVRFLWVKHSVQKATLEIDTMEAVGTKTGGSPAVDNHNYIIGSASVEATFTDAGVEFGDTVDLDISDYLKGVIILPAYLSDASKLSSLEVRLKTDDSNYYKVISSVDSIGDYFIDGWNMIKFEMQNATKVGTPTASDINEWSIIGTTVSGETLTIPFDKFTLQKFNPFYLEYFSKAPFVNGSTNAKWQTSVSNSRGDSINIDEKIAGILHYELCILVVQSSTFENINSQVSIRFQDQLNNKYKTYWSKHPSSEAPVSYSKSPEIDIRQDIDYSLTKDQTNTTS